MFKSKKVKFDPNMTDTLIGEGSLFEGKIKSEAGIRVEGQIIGDIECAGDVTIGENGIARSHIKARSIILAGQVIGNVAATGKLTIKASGKLQGNLSALELSIESGGIFQGASRMVTNESPASKDEAGTLRDTVTSNTVASGEDAVALKTW
ncbi:polymer-forming cytoskeletal protein [Cohnella sp.]|uniref:bactofilin family protein n=1 Tax=Cohnella sp. TaxID=1883426 RepID=UPI0035639E80